MEDKEKKSTMKRFTTNDQADYYLWITRITINGKNAYELKGKFFDDLHNNAFSGALWDYWKLGSDEVEPTNEKTLNLEETNQDDEQEIDPDALTSDIVGFKTYDEYKDDWIYKWNKNVSWVHEKPWTDTGVWT
ncbi:hypothetical protein Tco_1521591 [Tanacetum coccineum]